MCVNIGAWCAASTVRIATSADLINTDQGGRVIGVVRIGLIKKCGARSAGAHISQPLRHRGIALDLSFRNVVAGSVISAGPASSRFAESIRQAGPSN